MDMAKSALKENTFGLLWSTQGSMFLVVVDSHSKWPEMFILKETTATKTIEILCDIFARFGLPEQVFMKNG